MASAKHITVFQLCLISTIFLASVFGEIPSEGGTPEEQIRKRIFANYSKAIRPNGGTLGPPVEVNVTMFVLSMDSVDEHHMRFTTDFYFRQKWIDPRLTFDFPDLNAITGSVELADQLWKPDTFIANSRQLVHQPSVSTDHSSTFVRISPTGEVLYSTRIQVTAGCGMNLRYYPADYQICTLEFESYAFSTSDIQYQWEKEKNPVSITTHLYTLHFSIRNYHNLAKVESLTTGNYSRLQVEFELQRITSIFVTRVYIPAFILVALTWFAFWLHPREDRTLRVGLHVASIFALLYLYSQVDTPHVSYITSLDTYFIISVLLVLIGLKLVVLLAAFHSSSLPSENIPESGTVEEEAMLSSGKFTNSNNNNQANNHRLAVRIGNYSQKINYIARFVFPILFVVFNLFYFCNLGK